MNNYLPHDSGGSEAVQSETFGHSLIIEESPLVVMPSLAVAIGLEEAIVLQQLHFLLRLPSNGKELNGHRWIYNTYEGWQKFFPFLSMRTIRRVFTRLEEMFLVETCQPEGRKSRRKYYRLNRGGLQLLRTGRLKRPTAAEIDGRIPDVAKLAASGSVHSGRFPCTKNTGTEKTKTKETPLVKGGSLFDCGDQKHNGSSTPADDPRLAPKTKSASCSPAPQHPSSAAPSSPRVKIKPAPTEWEFEEFLSKQELNHILNKRPDLFSELSNRFWLHTDGKPIANWKSYVIALEKRIEEATEF